MDKVLGVIRHIVTIAGGVLIGIGVMDADQAAALTSNFEAIAGGVLALAGIAASVVAKLKGFKLFGGGDTEAK